MNIWKMVLDLMSRRVVDQNNWKSASPKESILDC